MNFALSRDLQAEIGQSLLFLTSDRAFKGCLVGIKSGEYIIIEVPRTADTDQLLIEGNKISGALMVSGTVMKLEATIKAYIRRPARMLIASWPILRRSHDLRKTSRVNCNIPCVLKSSSTMKEYTGLIMDLSTGGCKCHTKSITANEARLFEQEKNVVIDFELLGSDKTNRVWGEVKSTDRDGGTFQLGIQFCDTEQQVLDDISQYVSSVTSLLP
ncbi:MAG: PilZ domain-containing protein [Syntrophobacteraceae bacterium]